MLKHCVATVLQINVLAYLERVKHSMDEMLCYYLKTFSMSFAPRKKMMIPPKKNKSDSVKLMKVLRGVHLYLLGYKNANVYFQSQKHQIAEVKVLMISHKS